MDPERYQRVKEVFGGARDLEGAARRAFLGAECGGDAELRREVEELLEAETDHGAGALARALDGGAGAVTDPSRAPEKIGPYRLGELLGEGGMGEVYVAEQEEPIRRRVALKLIRPGLETKAIVARFETERQALALMDHHNIARALDAGATVEGRPYFVMEYVEGVPITEYCDRARLTTSERLELLAQVCDGLQHAHQKAILHRDIKPSNVLVAVEDGRPVPKIIDFGVAKATAQRLTERTLFTELGQVIGTPEYMSPEQATLSGDDLDTRTDIYSMGVLMYEVLVGVLPFDPGDLREAGFDEILRRIREVDPPRPSTRLTDVDEDSQAAVEHRRTTVHRLTMQLRGDLDWITMKALEKDRARRYGSASDLADDLRRFLRHEPVSAGPPSAVYRLSKFVRRNRIGVAFAALGAVFLVVIAVSSAVQSKRLARERDRANAEATSQRNVTEYIVGLFEDADPARTKGEDVTVREVLDAGARRVASLDAEPAAQASFREAIGDVYGTLGLFDESQALLEAAHAYRTEENDGSIASELAYARSTTALATLYVKRGEPERAVAMLREALEIQERRGVGPGDVAVTLNALGNALWNSGEMGEAEEHHRRALDLRRGRYGDRHDAVASSLHNVGSLRFIAGDLESAEQIYREAIDVAEAVNGPVDYGLATTLHTLAMVYSQQGRYADALPLEERSLEIREKVLGPTHAHVALSLTTLAGILDGLGEAARGEPHARRAVEIGVEAWGEDHMDVWWMKRGHADLLNALGRHDEALEIMEPLVARIDAAPRPVELGYHLAALGECYLGLERTDDAIAAYRRSIEVHVSEAGEDDPDAAVSRIGLARAQADAGEDELAEANFQAGLDALEATRGVADPDFLTGVRDFAAFLRARGREAEASRQEARSGGR